MTENKQNLAPDSQPDEDIPDLTAQYWKAKFEAAPVKRGRPVSSTPKVSTTVRLDPDVLAALKAGGKGWQTRLNNILRETLSL